MSLISRSLHVAADNMSEPVEVLRGGVGNAGAVIRVGDEVHRPASEHSRSIHELLGHLRSTGFTAAPEVLGWVGQDGVGQGRAGQSRERLGFIPGDVPIPPFPTWSQTEEALASVAHLLRAYHQAVRSFVPAVGATWNLELADPAPGDDSVLCHNDLCPENVVFRDGAAVAMLDFEFAAPGRPLWDLSAMATMCVPLDAPEDAIRTGRGGLNPFARLRVVAEAYGLSATERSELLELTSLRMSDGGDFVRRRVERGELAFVEMWRVMGGQDRYDRRAAWFDSHSERFRDELGCE